MRALLAAGFLGMLALAATGSELPDPDIWWNTAEGSYRLAHGGSAPPLAWYGAHGCADAEPLVTALPSLALGWVDTHEGQWGLVLLRALLVAVCALCACAATRAALPVASRGAWAAAIAAGALVCGALANRASPRPELFSLALLSILALLCARYAARPPRVHLSAASVGAGTGSRAGPGAGVRALLAVAALQAVWVWSHGYAVLGPVVAVAAAIAIGIAVPAGASLRARTRGWPLVVGSLLGFAARPAALLDFGAAARERAIAEALRFKEYASPLGQWANGDADASLLCTALLVLAPLVALATARTPPDIAPEIAKAIATPRRRALASVVASAPFVALGLDTVRGLALIAAAAPLFIGALALLAPRMRAIVCTAAFASVLFVAGLKLPDDPAVNGRTPPDLVPMRLAPMLAARYLIEQKAEGRVLARLHLGNWLLHEAPGVEVVWSGRRTYSLACAQEIGAALEQGGEAFTQLDARVQPDWVLVMHAEQRALLDTLRATGWKLRAIDLRYALFAREQPVGTRFDANPEAILAAENRVLPYDLRRALMRSTCATMMKFSQANAEGVCEAAALMVPDPKGAP